MSKEMPEMSNQILTDVWLKGKHTIVRLEYNAGDFRVEALGIASKHPKDEEDIKMGIELALGRAFQSLGQGVEKAIWEKIK